MKDVHNELQEAIYTALNGNVTYDSTNVPVYAGYTPDSHPDNYILISTITANDDSTKDAFLQNCTVLLDIVTRFKTKGSNKPSNSISNSILELIHTSPGSVLSMTSFTMTFIYVDSIHNLEEIIDDGKVIRKLIRLRTLIEEN